MRLRSAAVLAPAALLVIGLAAPANATVSVSGSDIIGDGGNDSITVSCAAGLLSAGGMSGGSCAPMTSISVKPGAGSDTVDLTAVTAADFPALLTTGVDLRDTPGPEENDSANGSPLDDVITGDYSDSLIGNAGNDHLTGGISASGGLGDDAIIDSNGTGIGSGGPGDDRFINSLPRAGVEGGSGVDTWEVDFDKASPHYGSDLSATLGVDQLSLVLAGSLTSVPFTGIDQVYVTLLRGDVQAWDGASFPGVQHIRGMAGVDTLIGGPADDVLYAGGGNDTVTGGGGADLLSGGDGDDTISARDGVADRIDCGAGTDSVVADAVDVLAGCETVDQPALPAPPAPPAPQVVQVQVQVPVVPVTNAVAGPGTVKKGKSGTFTFGSPTPGATFQCSLDNGAWKTCASAYKLNTKKLKAGKHTLLVRALLGGAADATPSTKAFKVKKG